MITQTIGKSGTFMRIRLFLLVASALLANNWARSQDSHFALHDGDHVVFYGDSITAQRLYTRFVEDMVLTRYPSLHVTFFNAGIPGDTVSGGYTGDRNTRLKRDLFPHEPSVVTIMLGMNDGFYVPFDPKYLKIYQDGYRDLIKAIQTQSPAVRITLISPTPYDEITHGTEFPRYNEVVSRHADFVRQLAASSHYPFSDFGKTVSGLLVAAHQNNPELASLLVPDRIHPGEAAHWLMAVKLAQSWGLSPIVSTVQLDATRPGATKVERSHVENLEEKEGTFMWTQTDDALPLPLPLYDRMMQLVLERSTLADMDQQILRVDHLPSPEYRLRIDGREIGIFKREQLAAGVNLALFNTPMQEQAKDVDGIELKRMRLDETNFIVSIEDPKVSDDSAMSRVLASKDSVLIADQRKAAQPKAHRFELTPP
jgi:lysophospholipase L1-like esterase